MTREEILRDNKVNEYGIICTPGKFEGEMLYAPYFYELMLDDSGDDVYDEMPEGMTEDEEDCFVPELLYTEMAVMPEDRTEFPELDPATTHVRVSEGGAGFVHVEEV